MVVLSKWWCCLRPILLLKLNPSFCSTTSVYIISVTLCVRACVRACMRVCAVRLLLLSWLCSWWTTLYIPHLTGFYISCRSRRTSYRYYDITFKIKSQFLFYDCINKCDSVCVCVYVCARVCVCVCVCVYLQSGFCCLHGYVPGGRYSLLATVSMPRYPPQWRRCSHSPDLKFSRRKEKSRRRYSPCMYGR